MKAELKLLADIDKASNIKYKDLESKILSEKINLESLRIKTEIFKLTQEHKYCKKCELIKKKKTFCFFCGFFYCKKCISSKRRRNPEKPKKFIKVCKICEDNFLKLFLFEDFNENLELKKKLFNDNTKIINDTQERIDDLILTIKNSEMNSHSEIKKLEKKKKKNIKNENLLKTKLKSQNEELIEKTQLEQKIDNNLRDLEKKLNKKRNKKFEIEETTILKTDQNNKFVIEEEKLKKNIIFLINSIYAQKNIQRKANVEFDSQVLVSQKPKLLKRKNKKKKKNIDPGSVGFCKCIIF